MPFNLSNKPKSCSKQEYEEIRGAMKQEYLKKHMYSPAAEAKHGDFSHLSNWIEESTINQCWISGEN